jgi:hypothetical protein
MFKKHLSQEEQTPFGEGRSNRIFKTVKVPNSADNDHVKELYDDDSDSGHSEHTIEVRSSFGSDPEDRPKNYGDDISVDPEF